MTTHLHVRPLNDGVEHDTASTEPDCALGPEVRPVQRDDGSFGWLIVHHAFDGRELAENADTYVICCEYGMTPAQVDEMGPAARALVLDFLRSRTAPPRPTLRQRITGMHWRVRRAIWTRRHSH